jgi:hypothetical protein
VRSLLAHAVVRDLQDPIGLFRVHLSAAERDAHVAMAEVVVLGHHVQGRADIENEHHDQASVATISQVATPGLSCDHGPMGVLVYEQSVNSGHNFDGSAPPGDPVPGSDIVKKFPIADTGGLFDFGITSPHWIASIQLILGGQTTWTLSIVDEDSAEVVVWAGTTESSFVALESDRSLILEGQTLKLVTTGTTTNDVKARIALSSAG